MTITGCVSVTSLNFRRDLFSESFLTVNLKNYYLRFIITFKRIFTTLLYSLYPTFITYPKGLLKGKFLQKFYFFKSLIFSEGFK